MATLANRRHELFAQEVAKGRSNREAYGLAGYETKDDTVTDAAASRLLSDVRVQARVTELQERAAVKTEITIADITSRLLAIATKAEAKDDAPMLSVARASLMDAAKLNGLAPEKLTLDGSLGLTHTVEPAELRELGEWARAALAGSGETAD